MAVVGAADGAADGASAGATDSGAVGATDGEADDGVDVGVAVGCGVAVGVLVGDGVPVGVGVGVGLQSKVIDLAKTFEGLFLSLIETQRVPLEFSGIINVVTLLTGFVNWNQLVSSNASCSVLNKPVLLSNT